MIGSQAEHEARQIWYASNRHDREYERDRAEAARMAEVEYWRERELILGFKTAHQEERNDGPRTTERKPAGSDGTASDADHNTRAA